MPPTFHFMMKHWTAILFWEAMSFHQLFLMRLRVEKGFLGQSLAITTLLFVIWCVLLLRTHFFSIWSIEFDSFSVSFWSLPSDSSVFWLVCLVFKKTTLSLLSFAVARRDAHRHRHIHLFCPPLFICQHAICVLFSVFALARCFHRLPVEDALMLFLVFFCLLDLHLAGFEFITRMPRGSDAGHRKSDMLKKLKKQKQKPFFSTSTTQAPGWAFQSRPPFSSLYILCNDDFQAKEKNLST